MHLLFCRCFIVSFSFLRGVELRHFLIFYIRNAKGVPSLCNLQLQQYSFLYIHTLHDDFSHIEDVHLPFCAHFIFSFLFLMGVELRQRVPSFCNLYLQQYSLLYIQTLLNGCSHIEDVHFLFCANIFFFHFFDSC